MSKKNLGDLMQLQEAVVEIKKIKLQIGNENPKLSEALEIAERTLLDQMFEEVSRRVKKGHG